MTASRFLLIGALAASLSGCSANARMTPATGALDATAEGPAETSMHFADRRAAALPLPRTLRLTPALAREQAAASAWAQTHPLRHGGPFRDTAKGQYLWVADPRGAIWQTRAGKTPQASGRVVVGGLFDCQNPLGIKVDGAGNLWAACAPTGTVNMYAPGATKATLVLRENRTVGKTQYSSIPDDVAFDRAGNVYVGNEFTIAQTGSNATESIGDVDVFLAKAACGHRPCNHATPDIVVVNPHANLSVPSETFSQSGQTFVDLDSRGNLYEDFLADVYSDCTASGCRELSTIGVDSVTNPLGKKPAFKSLVRGMVDPGGLYTTSNGRVLNVLDRWTRVITRYSVAPFKSIGWIGPLPGDLHFNDCDPFAIGFNADESLVAAGDIQCHDAVVGTVKSERFVTQTNIAYGDLGGAAFDPSDK